MSNTLPQFQLATENVVPDTAEVVEFAMNGNIDGLKDLFSRKLASPRDVSVSRRFTLIRVGFATPFSCNIYVCFGKELRTLSVGALRWNAPI